MCRKKMCEVVQKEDLQVQVLQTQRSVATQKCFKITTQESLLITRQQMLGTSTEDTRQTSSTSIQCKVEAILKEKAIKRQICFLLFF